MPVIDVSGLIDELRAHYLALVPALAANGVYEAEHVASVAWAELPLPYGVIIASQWDGLNLGVTNLAFVGPIELWYVQAAAGASTSLRTVLETMIDGFWPPPRSPVLTKGQVQDVLAWGYGADLEPNRKFLQDDPNRRAGFVRLNLWIGRTR